MNRKHFIFLTFLLLFSGIIDLKAQIDSTNLPLFIVNTHLQPIMDEPKITADLKIIYRESSFNHPEDSGNIYTGKIGIEIRGKYSASLPQKPYGIETRDSTGKNLNIPLFHMPAENDWILLANYNDKTFMRNTLTFELFRKMGHYAPRTQFCEVMVNKTYQGIYVFTEKIKRDKNRVDIATLNPDENSGDDVTGGYIFKIDYFDENNSWTSKFSPEGYPDHSVHFVYEYPKEDEISSEQKKYIRNYIDEFEQFLYSGSYSLSKISNYIDLDSFIDYFILNEVARNVDAYKKSSIFYKDKDSDGGLIHMGPVWDFDWAWKNINECFFGATDGSGWAYKVHDCNIWPVPPTWMNRLIRDPAFAQMVSERYFSLRDSYLNEDYIFNYIDSSAQILAKAQVRHFRKWDILGINVGAPETDYQPDTFEGEIEKFKNWISTRLHWLDNHMPEIVVTDLPIAQQIGNIQIYPNPASDLIHIASIEDIRELSLFSMNGRALLTNRHLQSPNVSIDIKEIPEGIYLVRAVMNDGRVLSEKILITN